MKNKKTILVFLVFSILLFSFRLDKSPVHLNQDELMFSLNAKAIAMRETDYYGTRLPFYFWHLGSLWATPVMVYLTALILKLLPFSESTIRLSSVLVGTLSVYLIMLLTNNIFRKKKLTIVAGILALTTPVLFIHSRLLLDNLYTVPFILLWLVSLKYFLDTKKVKYLLLSGLSLGVGLHSYHAAKIIMPIFAGASAVFLYKEKVKYSNIKYLMLGFVLPIIAFIPWLIKNPTTLLNQVSYISSIDKSVSAANGIWGVFNIQRLVSFLTNYVSYLDPRILFIEGDRSLIHSTHLVGAFTFPVIFLFVFGILQILLKEKTRFSKLILFGFFVYPIAPAIVNDPQRISRGLMVIPFVILISVYGVKFLMESREKTLKLLIVPLLLISIFQFSGFLYDYFGDYRERSYAWFNGDIGGGLESVLNSTRIRDVNYVYLDENIPFITYYSDFFQIKTKINISDKQIYFDYIKEDFTNFPKKSIVLIQKGHLSGLGKEDVVGEFEKVETIREPNGNESFYVYYRD